MQKGNDILSFINDCIYQKKIEINDNFENDNAIKIIKIQKKKSVSQEILYKLATGFHYAYEYENILEFADEFQKIPETDAIAVLDYNNNVKGIILKKFFFDMLGKPYGRDIYKNKNLIDIAPQCAVFYEYESIIVISEKLKEELTNIDNNYYILINQNDEFSGIMSTKNILIYLSQITQKDVDLARRLQRSIVNEEEIINENNFEVIGVSRMAKEVGGDFYLIRKIDDCNHIFSLFDISGKGISASLLTALLGGMFYSYDFSRGICDFMAIINEYIFNSFRLEKYATGILLNFDSQKYEMSILDAGHSLIYLYKDNFLSEIKTQSNLPVGIERNYKPVLSRMPLKSGDIIFVFSDGLIDQTNNDNVLYNLERITKIFNDNYPEIHKIKNELIKDLENFIKGSFQNDDITFIIIKIK